MQPSLFSLAHHDGISRSRVSTPRELRPTVRQLTQLGGAVRKPNPR